MHRNHSSAMPKAVLALNWRPASYASGPGWVAADTGVILEVHPAGPGRWAWLLRYRGPLANKVEHYVCGTASSAQRALALAERSLEIV